MTLSDEDFQMLVVSIGVLMVIVGAMWHVYRCGK